MAKVTTHASSRCDGHSAAWRPRYAARHWPKPRLSAGHGRRPRSMRRDEVALSRGLQATDRHAGQRGVSLASGAESVAASVVRDPARTPRCRRIRPACGASCLTAPIRPPTRPPRLSEPEMPEGLDMNKRLDPFLLHPSEAYADHQTNSKLRLDHAAEAKAMESGHAGRRQPASRVGSSARGR